MLSSEQPVASQREPVVRVCSDSCLICQAPAIMPLQRGQITYQSCQQHMGEVHNLLRVSKEFFQGFSF